MSRDRIRAEFEVLGVGSKQCVGVSEGMISVAAPTIVCGVRDYRGSHGIQLDVPQARDEVPLGLYEGGLVAAVPKGAAAPILSVDVLNVTPAERHDQSWDLLGIGSGE